MFPLIFLLATTSAMPTYDVQSFCRSIGSGGQGLSFKACGDSERDSRTSLVRDWSTFPRKARDGCVAAMNVAPGAGYTELRVCIELATPLKGGQEPTLK